MFCKSCGTMLEDGAAFCSQCGAAVTANPTPQQSAYQPPYQQPYPQPIHAVGPNTTKGVVYQSLRSPLAVVMAVAITLFAVIALIDQIKDIGNNFESLSYAFTYGDVGKEFLVLLKFLIIILLIVGFVAMPIGVWMMLFPNDNRLIKGAKVASIGTRALAGMTTAYLILVYIGLFSVYGKILGAPSLNSDEVSFQFILSLLFATAMFAAVAAYFAKAGSFLNTMVYYASIDAAHVQRSRGKGVAIASFVMAVAVLVCIIGAQSVLYDHPLAGEIWAYGVPWYEAIFGMLAFASFGAFALKFSLDTDKLRIGKK